ncbi:hypothetical protein OSTOST_17512 [Ostertagia ostertagi]
MDPIHLLDDVADADSVASDVKPTVAPSVPAEEGSSEVLRETSGLDENLAAPNAVDDVAMEGTSTDAVGGEDHSDVQSLLSEIVALPVKCLALITVAADKLCNLGHAKCNIEEELLDIKEKCRELSTRNSELQSQVASSMEDVNERSRLYRQLEASRNELAMKKMALDCDLERLKHEKEERDAAIRTLTKEKHLIATENFALKDELQKALNEKAALTQEKNSIDQEMRSVLAERERARAENEMYTNSRKWFLQGTGAEG